MRSPYYFLWFNFTLARRCWVQSFSTNWTSMVLPPPLLFVWKSGAGGLVCTLTLTPTTTLSSGLKLVADVGRMPLSLCLSQQELEGSETVSYDDTASANQPIIVHECKIKRFTTQCLKKRSERWTLTASTESDYTVATEVQILYLAALLIWTNVSWWSFNINPSFKR